MSESEQPLDKAKHEAAKIGVGGFARHIFLCVGPDCCTVEEGAAAWGQLKKGVARLNKASGEVRINRTKVGCLRICEEGPTAVVYPEGTWYAGLTPEQLNRVIEEDLGAGRVVRDLVIGEGPLE